MRFLVKQRTRDADIIAKAKHMLRRRTVQQVSDYLGICPEQVQALKNSLPKGVNRGRPSKVGP